MQETLNHVKAELTKQGFFEFEKQIPQIEEKFLKSLNSSLESKNKRNVSLPHTWEQINSFGKKRPLLLIELGGTYLKLYKILIDKSKIRATKKTKINFYQDITYTPTRLFTELTTQLKDFLTEQEQQEMERCIFVFSFPTDFFRTKQGTIDGTCTMFGKNHKSRGIIGTKIASSLQAHLHKNGFPKIKVSVTNDASASLLSAKHLEIKEKYHFDAIINLIVGTGANMAVGFNRGKNFFLSNTEFGTWKFFPQTEYDKRMNKKTDKPSQYHTEKMFSGAWRCAIFKEIFSDLHRKKILDKKTYNHLNISKLDSAELDQLLKYNPNPKKILKPLSYIWDIIDDRGGYICGLALALTIIHLHKSHKKVRFAIVEVGAVLDNSKIFRKRMLETLKTRIEEYLDNYNRPDQLELELFAPNHPTITGAAIFDDFLTY